LPECHSTNTVALELIQNGGAQEGTLVITEHQTSGRGQRGNQWASEKGQNLTFSFILNPRFLAPKDQFMLGKAISLGLHDFVSRVLPQDFVQVKWPNDLIVNGRKVSGVLIENQLSGSLYESAVVGIGLNVNQLEFPVPTAASLSTFAHHRLDLDELLDELCLLLEQRYQQLKRGDWDSLNKDYLNVLYWFREEHTFFSKSENFVGVIEGVDEIGRLLVRVGAEMRTFDLKEILYIQ
jgi:BirA family biotin operon repressor/biotin-[acetyl-CoA-carboxylase] ligase